ncbi:unnamed protein product, partial [Choristocarpus tenellus]
KDIRDPDFILRNVDLRASLSLVPKVEESYLARKEAQRILCSQCLFVAGMIPLFFQEMTLSRKMAKYLSATPVVGIVGAAGQLGSAITQTLLDHGWHPARIAISGREQSKLQHFK